jgi:glycosyltransferase involved in cell wall biosynthesis
MKIAIDVSQIIYGTGVSVYTEELVKNLLSFDKENSYVLFGGSLRRQGELKAKARSLGTNSSLKVFPIPPTLSDFLWNKLHILPIETFVGKIDVFHSSDWSQPPSAAFKVTTVHDLAPIKFPRVFPAKIVEVYKRRLARVAQEADSIIVPSEATNKDLLELGFLANKIRVIPEAAGSEFSFPKTERLEEIKTKYRIRGKYLLSVGVGWRKNSERLIKAFEQARVKKDLNLVIAGRVDKKLEMQRGVNLIGHIASEELAVLYSGAEALVYPSLYEGFGLPILQGFASGCPVVTSNISSMPEVAGDAAVLVDPYDVSAIAEGIREAIRDKRRLVSQGKKRAREFSWEKCARETLTVYSEANTGK